MTKSRTWGTLLLLAAFWLVVVIYILATISTSSEPGHLEKQLAEARDELEELRLKNNQLQELAQQVELLQATLSRKNCSVQLPQIQVKPTEKSKDSILDYYRQFKDMHMSGDGPVMPGAEMEQLRRKIMDGVKEQWFYLRSALSKLKGKSEGAADTEVDQIKARIRDQYLTVLADLHNMTKANSQDLWRQTEAEELSALVQNRFEHLQNPPSCNTAKRVLCSLNKGCGFGCQLHHAMFCFSVAYGSGRTLILDSHQWRYASGGWETLYQPLSKTCTERVSGSRQWPADENTEVIALPIVDSMHPRPSYLPLSIPADLADRLKRFHGNPAVWWNGQIAHYLSRPNSKWQETLDRKTEELNFHGPIVGVQVRRTDKVGTEAAFHKLSEYMEHVEEYFDLLDKIQGQAGVKRRIYLASDDPSVHEEAKKSFPHYDVIGDPEISKSAGPSSRYSITSLQGVLIDIHFLSRCDYLVCTFSSQVCRVAYEHMQTLHPDASKAFYSLDDIYYFGGQHGHNRIAVEQHEGQSHLEIDMSPGDFISIAGNHWDGMSKGTNHRTGKMGLFPSYKVIDEVRVVAMPLYKEADDKFHAQRKLKKG